VEREVDICIVGAAGSGMSAAIVAAQKGVKKVLVLEKMKAPGGCTSMTMGMMGINTPAQRRFGKHYSVDQAFRDLMRIHNWNCDALMVRKWLNGSGENFEWLENLGLTYDFVTTETADPRIHRNTHHRFGDWDGGKWVTRHHGKALVKCLRDACDKYGVEIITQARAKHLLQADDGSVNGVVADGRDGELRVHAGVVILATGSISSNRQLIKRFYNSPEYEDVRIMADVPHNTGDGLLMAEEIGASPGRIGTLFIGPHNHYPGASELTGMLMRRPQYMKVNIQGERFADESLPMTEEFGWMFSAAVDNLPGKRCYVLIDQKRLDDVAAGRDYMPPRIDGGSLLEYPMALGATIPPDQGKDPAAWRERIMEHMEYEQQAGRAKVCHTLEEAAAFVGCDARALRRSVERYNLFCARGYDEDFLKDPDYLFPCEQPPYYVLLGRSGVDTCLGGLKVDNRQRVVRRDGSVIPGLYGAGVMCSGWFSNLYCFFGSEMSYTIYSGRTAGAEAAAYIAGDAEA
jgi:fumarate reductase flavoprotein subunit